MNELDIWHDNKSRPPPQPTYAVVCGGPLGWAGHEVWQEGSGALIREVTEPVNVQQSLKCLSLCSDSALQIGINICRNANELNNFLEKYCSP